MRRRLTLNIIAGAALVVRVGGLRLGLEPAGDDRLAGAADDCPLILQDETVAASPLAAARINLRREDDADIPAQVELHHLRALDAHNGSIQGYLSQVHRSCRHNPNMTATMPDLKDEELQKRFSRPDKLIYSPWATSLPVLYITDGKERLPSFQRYNGMLSPLMVRVDAVVLGGNETSDRQQLDALVESPAEVMEVVKGNRPEEWQKALGCLVSHLKAIYHAWASGMSLAVIVEDDALPLYPAWRSSLEEFAVSLPDQWQAAQLHWSSPITAEWHAKEHDSKEQAWVKGRGWGSAAYLLHRRGMQRLIGELWNPKSERFTLLRMAQRCLKMTADDCLLGFTVGNPIYTHVRWFPNPKPGRPDTEALTEVYLAEPTLFLHDSTKNLLHSRNYCQDVSQSKPLFRERPRPPPGAERLLLFMRTSASRSSNSAAATLRRSAHYLWEAGYHVFLAFDTGDQASARGLEAERLRTLRQYWTHFGESWVKRYDYVWAIDEDIALDEMDLARAAEAVRKSGASLAAPMLVSHPRHRRPKECKGRCRRLRSVDSVEIAAPLFRVGSLGWLMSHSKTWARNASEDKDLGTRWCESLRKDAMRRSTLPCVQLEGFALARNTTGSSSGGRRSCQAPLLGLALGLALAVLPALS